MSTAGRAPLILIVEDDPDIAGLLEIALQEAGYRTLRAETGHTAEELARQARPDLVLLDLSLPDKPGQAVLFTLRQQPETARIPVIVVTGYAEPVTTIAGWPAITVVEKPFDLDALLALIRDCLQATARPARHP